MLAEEELEFEIEEDEGAGEKPVRNIRKNAGARQKKARPAPERAKKPRTSPKKKELEEEEVATTKAKKARKVPIAEGIKRRLALNKREIERLRREITEIKDDKEAFESELESLESDFEKLRTDKERLEDEINHKIAVATALEKKQNRTQKDFENYKKRIDTEIERKAKMSQKKLLMGIIESLDNLDRAMSEASKGNLGEVTGPLVSGIESIRKTMLKTLEDQGVTSIDPLNQQFDPHIHDAVDTLMDRSKNENTVVSVEAKGYLIGEMVLRPAKVKVSLGGKPWPKRERPKKEDIEGMEGEGPKEERPKKGKKRVEDREVLDELDEVEGEELDEIMDEIDQLSRK